MGIACFSTILRAMASSYWDTTTATASSCIRCDCPGLGCAETSTRGLRGFAREVEPADRERGRHTGFSPYARTLMFAPMLLVVVTCASLLPSTSTSVTVTALSLDRIPSPSGCCGTLRR